MCGTDGQVLLIKPSNPSSVSPAPDEPTDHRPSDSIINLDHGDPTMYESYWKVVGQKYTSITIPGFQSLSYFANKKNMCWFLEPKLEEEIKRLHKIVGNAIVENRHIVVGTGSSQLILAALYALSDPLNEPNPISVVSAAPYYSVSPDQSSSNCCFHLEIYVYTKLKSEVNFAKIANFTVMGQTVSSAESYPETTDFLRSGLFKWSGDARCFNKEGPYIEMVTYPNNPDGVIREPVVNRADGKLIHDLAYYWPQYTAITSPADHDIILFTVSKCTGHAGSRIGWALVRNENIARKMVKFIEINTIGVSKEAQLRAANILETVSLSCQRHKPRDLENFFECSQRLMAERWKKLREVVDNTELFFVPKFPIQFCNFTRDFTETYPAFAWLKCKEGMDCEKLLEGHKILTRSGRRFGSGAEYVRISMLSRDEEFDLFLQRLLVVGDNNN
ncbi:Tryptophan aminotransferase-related protein 2 [Sesamum angolense]|uniref:Tryptophan aminotransferase-related protein 2 n=1 Tax=Sesamum angolense TaxID=2727404 RepID=A0AAE1X010_9LAMI|nr:Tryptophan aminotransferase-related protein 2 [Sesamum angolense]